MPTGATSACSTGWSMLHRPSRPDPHFVRLQLRVQASVSHRKRRGPQNLYRCVCGYVYDAALVILSSADLGCVEPHQGPLYTALPSRILWAETEVRPSCNSADSIARYMQLTCGTVLQNGARHNTSKHSIAQHNTAQHSTAPFACC